MAGQRIPLILITNDDGIGSPGLLAAVRAVWDLGELLVVAPRFQQSSAGRSFAADSGQAQPEEMAINGQAIAAFSVDTSPALAVRHGIMLLAERRPDLVISGINYGENLGVGVTISGTVGATIEGASFGIIGLAVSLETDRAYHHSYGHEVDFSAAAHFTRLFARRMLARPLPPGVDILKVDVPREATPHTPWRVTRVSRQSYYYSTIESDEQGRKRFTGYESQVRLEGLEPDSDIRAMAVDRMVSVSPLTIDLTARVDLAALEEALALV